MSVLDELSTRLGITELNFGEVSNLSKYSETLENNFNDEPEEYCFVEHEIENKPKEWDFDHVDVRRVASDVGTSVSNITQLVLHLKEKYSSANLYQKEVIGSIMRELSRDTVSRTNVNELIHQLNKLD